MARKRTAKRKVDNSPAAKLRREKAKQRAIDTRFKHHGTFMKAVEQAGLPTPIQEHKFHPTRKWRFDYSFHREGIQLAVEINGGGSRGRHNTVSGATNDAEKMNEAAILGWTVLTFTVISIKNTEYVSQTLLAAYQRLEAANGG